MTSLAAYLTKQSKIKPDTSAQGKNLAFLQELELPLEEETAQQKVLACSRARTLSVKELVSNHLKQFVTKDAEFSGLAALCEEVAEFCELEATQQRNSVNPELPCTLKDFNNRAESLVKSRTRAFHVANRSGDSSAQDVCTVELAQAERAQAVILALRAIVDSARNSDDSESFMHFVMQTETAFARNEAIEWGRNRRTTIFSAYDGRNGILKADAVLLQTLAGNLSQALAGTAIAA